MQKPSRGLLKSSLMALAGLVALSGCAMGNVDSDSIADPHAGHMMSQGDDQNNSEFGQMDIMFAQMMIPHHQQAVDMALLAPDRALSPEVLSLAGEILGEQDPEMQQMGRWLSEAGAASDMGHEMDMGGMLSEAEMTALAAASGAEFDRLFLEGMILHHQGAIQMTRMIEGSNNEEVRLLATSIVQSQTEQIELMRELLAKN